MTVPLPQYAGIGLRFPHQTMVVETRPSVAWFEIHAENYFGGGARLRILENIRAQYPLSLHGTALSLGSAETLDVRHLARLSELAARIEPALISEHLSFSTMDGMYLADLLPLPLTEEALTIVCRNIDQMQNVLRRRVLIENPSSYLRFRHSTIPEWEFLAELARRSGCAILCDVNNIYVSAQNHGWNAEAYLEALPPTAIGEIHLAGHAARQIGNATVLIDNHGSPVSEPVWALFDRAVALFGAKPALIEWDTDIPEFAVLEGEAAKANDIMHRATGEFRADAA